MQNNLNAEILSTDDDLQLRNNGKLVDLVDGLLDTGVVIDGDLSISVADVDLIYLGLRLVLTDSKLVLTSK